MCGCYQWDSGSCESKKKKKKCDGKFFVCGKKTAMSGCSNSPFCAASHVFILFIVFVLDGVPLSPETLPAHSAEAWLTVRKRHTSCTVKQSFYPKRYFPSNTDCWKVLGSFTRHPILNRTPIFLLRAIKVCLKLQLDKHHRVYTYKNHPACPIFFQLALFHFNFKLWSSTRVLGASGERCLRLFLESVGPTLSVWPCFHPIVMQILNEILKCCKRINVN